MTKEGKALAQGSATRQTELQDSTTEAIGRLKLIHDQIKDFDPALKEKAVSLLLEREFGGRLPGGHGPPRHLDGEPAPPGEDSSETPFSSLVERWSPSSQADWALLGGYYQSQILRVDTFTGQAVNSLLKHHGNGVSNITRAFKDLIDASPALILQVKKGGTSQQARKYYRITTQGVRVVREHLAAGRQGEVE